jgi:DNA-binding transcriptional ArsR family regulator
MARRPTRTQEPTPRSARAVTSTPGQPRIRDFTRAPEPIVVDFDVRTVFDFVFSLSDDAGSTDDLPLADRRWLAEGKTALRETVGDALELYASDLCIVLAGLAVGRPDVRRAAEFVELVRSTPDREIVRTFVAEELRTPETRPLAERALAGDAEAIEALAARMAEHGPGSRPGRLATLYRNPPAILDPARGILAAWLAHFEPIEARVEAMLRRDVELRAGDRSLPPAELIERTTGGIRWLSEPGIRRVILAPSYFARPYNYVLGGEDWRLFGYPIADAALDAGDPLAPPPSFLRLHRALADETRLRILRILRDRDYYLTEIAQILELSKPTVKHHLAQLRSAGLVTVIEEGGLTFYQLRRERLDAAADELRNFLRC